MKPCPHRLLLDEETGSLLTVLELKIEYIHTAIQAFNTNLAYIAELHHPALTSDIVDVSSGDCFFGLNIEC